MIDSISEVENDPVVERGAVVGPHVVFAGPGVRVQANARIDAASVIGEGVTLGSGCRIRAGSVVLRDVPPNAVVEGNPAQVVGYVDSTPPHATNPATLVEFGNLDSLKRPTRVPLEVGDCALYLMRRMTDARGSLTVGEVPTEVPFNPARYFTVFDVPSRELRGEHAHKRCQQFLLCVHGSCRVLLDDGTSRQEVLLDRPDMGVFMPEMIWGTQYRYSPDAVLLVFASRPYEAGDYLRSYDEFLTAVESRKS